MNPIVMKMDITNLGNVMKIIVGVLTALIK
jgi:hypothetical protein